MHQYHKIHSVFKREPDGKRKIIEGEYSRPEFKYLKNNIWDWTEKVDGTNIRVIFQDGKFTFKGKTDNAMLPAPLVQKLNDIFLPQAALCSEMFRRSDDLETTVCFYGEGYGPKIQSGGKYRKDQSFVLFDIWINGWWLERDSIESIASQLGIKIVPIIRAGTLNSMIEFVRNGFKSEWGDFEAEGVVARPCVELRARSGERVITKLKCRDFGR